MAMIISYEVYLTGAECFIGRELICYYHNIKRSLFI